MKIRKKVLKLAAILRIAIALDRSHRGYIKKKLTLTIEPDKVSIATKQVGDIAMERRDFELKKELMEKLLNKSVVLV